MRENPSADRRHGKGNGKENKHLLRRPMRPNATSIDEERESKASSNSTGIVVAPDAMLNRGRWTGIDFQPLLKSP